MTTRLFRAALSCALLSTLAVSGAFAQSQIVKLEAVASYYAEDFHGRPTSSGELFDMNALTAAHKTLPFGTMLEVTNLENGKKVIVRVNDRGPFVPNREIDVSKRAAAELDMIKTGVARVSIRTVSGFDAAATVAATSSNQPEPGTTTVTIRTAGPAGTVTPTNDVKRQDTAGTPGVAVTTMTGRSADSEYRWRIQLGSFRREDNATRLVVKLRSEGFNPSFETSGSMTRVVLAGISDAELASTRRKLDSAGYGEYLVRKETR